MAKAICIARQFGSGGHEVGAAIAKRLGYSFYDKELLAHAAEKSGIIQELFERNDEKPANGPIFPGEGRFAKAASFGEWAAGYMPADKIQAVIAEVIREVAQKGDCVIIGRCADYILRGRPGTVSVFVHAPPEVRIARIRRMHNLDEDAARALVRKTDRGRANYYSYYTDREWNDPANYDLAVDAGRLGVEDTAGLLAACLAFY